jgi:hypothetical protein
MRSITSGSHGFFHSLGSIVGSAGGLRQFPKPVQDDFLSATHRPGVVIRVLLRELEMVDGAIDHYGAGDAGIGTRLQAA